MKLWEYVGLTNYIEKPIGPGLSNDYRLLFLDYDNVSLDQVNGIVSDLSYGYAFLGDWLIVQTRPKHFWAINFSLLDKKAWRMLLKKSNCCRKYVEHSLKRGVSTIRLTKHLLNKKNRFKFVKLLINNEFGGYQSSQHLALLLSWCNREDLAKDMQSRGLWVRGKIRLVRYWRRIRDG